MCDRTLMNNIITFAAALGGAGAAFLLQIYRDSKKEEKRNIASLQKALFILGAQHNELLLINRNNLSPNINVKDRHLLILPFIVSSKIPDINLESLTFLLGTKDTEDTNLVFDILNAQNGYFAVIEAIKIRNDYHYKFQKILGENKNPEFNSAKFKMLTIQNPHVFVALENKTNQLYPLHKKVSKNCEKISEKISKYITENYEGIKPIVFIPEKVK